MTRNLNTLTSNEYYGGLNRRFDRRARLLRRLGFAYKRIEEANIAVFARGRINRPESIPAAVLHHADNLAWINVLRNAGVRTGRCWSTK